MALPRSPAASPQQGPVTPRLHPRVLVGLGIVAGLLMVVGGTVWALLAGQALPHAWFPREDWLRDVTLGALVGALFTVVAWHIFQEVPSLRRIERLLMSLLDMPALRFHHALLFGLLAGIPEEILFRGAMQPAWGLLPASVIFGALHAISFAYFCYATSAGLLLGALAQWFGGLWAPIAAHTVIDVLMFLLLMRRWQEYQRIARNSAIRPDDIDR
ncbi:MAG: hypothetical protein Kow00106_10780 [Anaerolineae bacterium]